MPAFVVLAGVATNLASDSVTWRVPLWILLGVAIVATAVAAWLTSHKGAPDPADPVEALAEVVRAQWASEAGVRDLLRPDPLPVRWSPSRA